MTPGVTDLRPAIEDRGACDSPASQQPQQHWEPYYRRGTRGAPEPIAEILERVRAELLRAAPPRGYA
jgi:hypothetical protein